MASREHSHEGSEKKLNRDGKLKVIIIGGSICGLCCAHAFLKSGVCSSLVVLEKASSLTAAGAGLGIDERSIQALEDWGLRDELFRHTLPLYCDQTRAKEQGICVTLSRDDDFRHQAVHWGDLHQVLYDALPSGIVHLGHDVISLKENEDHSSVRVSVSVASRAEGEEKPTASTIEEVYGDLVVAADGSMSRTRMMYSPSPPRRYSGYCAWRGVLDYTDLPQVYDEVKKEFPGIGETLFFELARCTHSVLYELKGNRLNWLWYVNQPEPELQGNSLTKHPDKETIEGMYIAADRTWMPALAQVMKLTPKPFINAIYDRDPLKQLAWGRVVLVGEAAHPTTPHGLRSTNMSIVDAHTLGKAFEKWGPDSIIAALTEYESERLPVTTQQVLFSRYLGQVKQGLLFEPKGSFPWPTADKKMREGLLIRNMHSFQMA
ncbi:unnamed protein product [Calypogeia fissa]